MKKKFVKIWNLFKFYDFWLDAIRESEGGNYSFIKSYFIRRISPIVSPTGQEALVPIEVFSCGNCGKVPDSMMPKGNE